MTAPNGATVNVSAERAKRLLAEGFQAADEKKAPAKKAAAKKSE